MLFTSSTFSALHGMRFHAAQILLPRAVTAFLATSSHTARLLQSPQLANYDSAGAIQRLGSARHTQAFRTFSSSAEDALEAYAAAYEHRQRHRLRPQVSVQKKSYSLGRCNTAADAREREEIARASLSTYGGRHKVQNAQIYQHPMVQNIRQKFASGATPQQIIDELRQQWGVQTQQRSSRSTQYMGVKKTQKGEYHALYNGVALGTSSSIWQMMLLRDFVVALLLSQECCSTRSKRFLRRIFPNRDPTSHALPSQVLALWGKQFKSTTMLSLAVARAWCSSAKMRCSSQFYGVHWIKRRQMWDANMWLRRKYRLAQCHKETHAAYLRDIACVALDLRITPAVKFPNLGTIEAYQHVPLVQELKGCSVEVVVKRMRQLAKQLRTDPTFEQQLDADIQSLQAAT